MVGGTVASCGCRVGENEAAFEIVGPVVNLMVVGSRVTGLSGVGFSVTGTADIGGREGAWLSSKGVGPWVAGISDIGASDGIPVEGAPFPFDGIPFPWKANCAKRFPCFVLFCLPGAPKVNWCRKMLRGKDLDFVLLLGDLILLTEDDIDIASLLMDFAWTIS